MIRERDNDENRLQNEPVEQNFTSPRRQSSAAYREGWGGGLGVRRGADMPEATARSVQSLGGAGATG